MYFDDLLSRIGQNYEMVYGNWMVSVALLVFLAIATYTDLQSMKIPDKLNIAFFVIRLILIPFVGFSIGNIVGALVGFFVLLIPAMIRMHKMGGDIKCMAVAGLYLGGYVTPIFIALSCAVFAITLLVMVKLRKVKAIPFAPFFLASHIILIILSFFV